MDLDVFLSREALFNDLPKILPKEALVEEPPQVPQAEEPPSRKSILLAEKKKLTFKLSKLKNTSSKKVNELNHAKRQKIKDRLKLINHELSLLD